VGLYNFLILNLNPHPCPADNCRQLPGLVRGSIPDREIDVRITTLFPPSATTSRPDLILLRPSSPKLLPDVLHTLRKKWSQSSILGIFCVGWDQPRDISDPILSGLDDFLMCPFKKVDLISRIRRLLQVRERTMAATRAEEGLDRVERLLHWVERES